jgi:hypothetical protein
MSQLTSMTKYDDREMKEWARNLRTPPPKALRSLLIEEIICFFAEMFF